MKTTIKTVHEENYSDKSKVIGVLLNHSDDGQWNESYIYIYNNGLYIFFQTIIEMGDYLLYGDRDKSIKRAYMKEDEFDSLYDIDYFNGTFNDKLKWG